MITVIDSFFTREKILFLFLLLVLQYILSMWFDCLFSLSCTKQNRDDCINNCIRRWSSRSSNNTYSKKKAKKLKCKPFRAHWNINDVNVKHKLICIYIDGITWYVFVLLVNVYIHHSHLCIYSQVYAFQMQLFSRQT